MEADEQTKITDDSLSNGSPDESDGASLLLGFILWVVLGVILGGIGIVNLKKEISNFALMRNIKSQGTGTLGTIIAIKQQYGYTGKRKRQYTYYMLTVKYDGFEETFQRKDPIPVGTAVPVLYLREEPDTVAMGSPNQTISDFKNSKSGDIFGLGFGFLIYSAMTIVGCGMLILLIFRGLQSVLHTVTGKTN